ncbi:hypothetical protein R50073_06590 [Maricurvus nonylphenolicus]|uniref:substrate-binding periplasmic protein n=1 Tax=Maricurvus nonylphenolicus TaxID=1008307 RepID=UPI0036F3547A
MSGFSRAAFLVALLGALLPFHSSSNTGADTQQSRPLVAAVYQELQPFSYIDKDGQASGILIEFLELLSEKMGEGIEYRALPHGRIIAELVSAEVDIALVLMIPGEIDLPPVDSVKVTPGPIFKMPLNYYINARRRPQKPYPETIELLSDLSGFRAGFLRAGSSDAHTSLQKKKYVVYFNSNESMVKSLLAGRIDFALMDPLTVRYWNDRLSADMVMKYPVIEASIHLGFSSQKLTEKADLLCRDFWAKLVELKRQGELIRHFSDYNLASFGTNLLPRIEKATACTSIRQLISSAEKP